jgi:PTS system N-acetylglucosamine-specific IIA component
VPVAILSPVTGTVRPLGKVPDPVFSNGLVGPGAAIEPDPAEGRDAHAPIAGTISKLHPHAFVVTSDDGVSVLVHLGIDTVQLGGEGFVCHVAQGDRVEAGQLVISWDPAAVAAGGRSAIVPVILLDVAQDAVEVVAPVDDSTAAGSPLLDVTL